MKSFLPADSSAKVFLSQILLFLLLVIGYLRIFYFTSSKKSLRKFVAYVMNLLRETSDYPQSAQFDNLKGSEKRVFDIVLPEPFEKLERNSRSRNKWLEQQRICFMAHMERLDNTRAQLKFRLRKFQKYEAFEAPFQVNNSRYFYSKKYRQDQRHFILFTTENVRHKGRVLLDPNIEFAYLPTAQLLGFWVSNNSNLLCYAYTENPSAEQSKIVIKVRDTFTGLDCEKDTVSIDLPEDTDISSFTISWMKKVDIGFFYTRRSIPKDCSDIDSEIQQIICFHKIGSTQSKDVIVHPCEKEYDISLGTILHPACPIVAVSNDDNYLIIELFEEEDSSKHSEMGNKIFVLDISTFDFQNVLSLGAVTKLVDSYSHRWSYILSKKKSFLFRTNYGAENFRVVKCDILTEIKIVEEGKSGPNTLGLGTGSGFLLGPLMDCVPEDSGGAVIQSACVAATNVLAIKTYHHSSGTQEITLYDLDDALKTSRPLTPVAALPHPPLGTISGPYCSTKSSDIFYRFSSYSEPCSIYRAVIRRHPQDNDIELSFDQVYGSATKSLDPSDFHTERITIEGYEGQQISMYIFGLRSSLASRSRPCILHPRESHTRGDPFLPSFSPTVTLFAKYFGGLFCVVDIGTEHYNASNYSGDCGVKNSVDNTNIEMKEKEKKVEKESRRNSTTKISGKNKILIASENLKKAAEYLLGYNNNKSNEISSKNNDSTTKSTPKVDRIRDNGNGINSTDKNLTENKKGNRNSNGNGNGSGKAGQESKGKKSVTFATKTFPDTPPSPSPPSSSTPFSPPSAIQPYCNAGQLGLHACTNNSTAASICVNKNPGLFSGVILDCGMFDLIRYQSMDPVTSVVGEKLTSDFGCTVSMSEEKEEKKQRKVGGITGNNDEIRNKFDTVFDSSDASHKNSGRVISSTDSNGDRKINNNTVNGNNGNNNIRNDRKANSGNLPTSVKLDKSIPLTEKKMQQEEIITTEKKKIRANKNENENESENENENEKCVPGSWGKKIVLNASIERSGSMDGTREKEKGKVAEKKEGGSQSYSSEIEVQAAALSNAHLLAATATSSFLPQSSFSSASATSSSSSSSSFSSDCLSDMNIENDLTAPFSASRIHSTPSSHRHVNDTLHLSTAHIAHVSNVKGEALVKEVVVEKEMKKVLGRGVEDKKNTPESTGYNRNQTPLIPASYRTHAPRTLSIQHSPSSSSSSPSPSSSSSSSSSSLMHSPHTHFQSDLEVTPTIPSYKSHEETLGRHGLKLHSARTDVYGTSVSASESEDDEDEDEDGMSNLDVLLDINQNKLEPRSPSSSPLNRRVLGVDPGSTFQNIDQNIQKNEVVLDGGMMNDNMSKRGEAMKSVTIRDGVRDMGSEDVTVDGKGRDKDRGSGRDKMGESERAEVHTSTLSPSSSSSLSSSEVLAKEGEGRFSHQANSACHRCSDSSNGNRNGNGNGNDDVNGARNSVGRSTGDKRSKKGCHHDTRESNSNGSDKTGSTTASRNTVSEWRGKNDDNSNVLEKKNHKIAKTQEEKKGISNNDDVSKTNGDIHGNDDDVSLEHHENNKNYEITDGRTTDGLHELHGWYDVLGTHTASSSECSRLLSLSPLHSVMKQHTPIASKSFFSFSSFTGKHGNKVKSLYPAILIVTRDGTIQYKDKEENEKEKKEDKQGAIPIPHRFQIPVPVPSSHSFKYIAALQSTIGAQHESKPLLLLCADCTSPKGEAEANADILAFLADSIGAVWSK